MPNWCSTNYTLNYDSETTAEKANEIIEYFKNNPIYEYLSGFGRSWLGNVVEFFGLPIEEGTFHIPCRGEIDYWCQDGRSFRIDTETAWTFMPEPILLFRLLGDCEIGYHAEEPGCEVYVNDGCCYDDEWMVDTEDGCEYLSSDGMRSLLEEWFKNESLPYEAEKSLEDLVEFYNSHTEREDFFSIHKFEVVPFDEVTNFSLEQAKERIKSSPIPVYEVRYKKDGEEYRTYVGVAEKERFMQAIDKLREAGYEMVSFTPCKKGRTAFELWLESTDRVREAAAV